MACKITNLEPRILPDTLVPVRVQVLAVRGQVSACTARTLRIWPDVVRQRLGQLIKAATSFGYSLVIWSEEAGGWRRQVGKDGGQILTSCNSGGTDAGAIVL